MKDLEGELRTLDLEAAELIEKLKRDQTDDLSMLISELNAVALRAAQLAYAEGGLEWLSDRLHAAIRVTDHIDDPGGVDELLRAIRSGHLD